MLDDQGGNEARSGKLMAQPADDAAESAVDLTNCDREPIHIPGSIQSHGFLLVCSGPQHRVAHVSANISELLNHPPEHVIGRPLEDLVGTQAAETLLAALRTTKESVRSPSLELQLPGGKRCHACIVHDAGRVLVELEPAAEDGVRDPPLLVVSTLLSRMQRSTTVAELCNEAAKHLRSLLRFDRVMIYRFLHDGSGQVVAEAKRHDLEPFLHLHYPASDIPQQARALYVKNRIRLIADVASSPVAIIPERDASHQSVDLTFVALRSVSPVHIQYLRNMGVGASMSISIVVGGKLWGLVACHHDTAKIVSADIRSAVDLFGHIFSLQIECIEPSERAILERQARANLDRLLAGFQPIGPLIDSMAARLGDLRSIIPCDGIGVWIDGTWRSQGDTPPPMAIPALARFVEASAAGTVFASHELPNRLPAAASYAGLASGLLAIPMSRTAKDYLLFFRQEVVRTVKWAGDPNKPVIPGPGGGQLSPRKSFESWASNVHGQSLPWTQVDLLTAEALRISLLEVVLRLHEVAAHERAQAAERQRLLVTELNHRVKNVLALVSALVGRGHIENETLVSFVKGLEGRIRALSFAHSQAMEEGGGRIADLFAVEIKPYARDGSGTIRLDGPDLKLDALAFSVLALVIHETVTNAAKYGALSTPNGCLAVEWRRDISGDCVIDWQESGGPAVQAPTRTGFGTILMNRQITYELGGSAEVHFELDGLRARYLIPARHLVETDREIALERPEGTETTAEGLPLSGLDILLVEDSLLIALDAEAMLIDLGAAHVEVAGTVAEALACLARRPCGVAVLDVNLGQGTSIPVADELARRNIPFLFASGYNDKSVLPKRFSHVRMVGKPYSPSALESAIADLMA
jgi:light-regulated signal transduction histidine kinase (bacteriophytochrome)/CheY-like chemotaxis protein